MYCKQIVVKELGKRYQKKWIFKGLSNTFIHNQSYAICGPNGAGKSTLLRLLSAYLTPSAGEISFLDEHSKEISKDEIYQTVSFAAPYISLIERFTLEENIELFSKFRSFQPGLNKREIVNLLNLGKLQKKELRFYSSGMMQRVKLALSICSSSDILILDEPSTNLDTQGANWYRELIRSFGKKDRILIIASNVEADFDFCDNRLDILAYKAKSKKGRRAI